MIRPVACALAVLAVPAAASPKLPAHYAALFEKGRSWSYDVTLTVYDEAPAKTTRQVVTCTVAEVLAVPSRGVVSRVVCTPHVDADFVEHDYLASPDGLRFVDTGDKMPRSEAEIDAAIGPVVMPAHPKAFRTVTKETVVNPKGVVISGMRVEGHGWCTFADSSTADPDGSEGSQCFAEVGITHGELHRLNKLYKITYKLKPPK